MKKIIIAVSAVLLTVATAQAQKTKTYKIAAYTVAPVETDDVSITVDNAISNDKETKFKLKIKNKTPDYIIYKPEETKFMINGQEMKTTEKWMVIGPNEDDWKIINLKGTGFNSTPSYSLVMDGLYKVSSSTKGIETPDFRLPVTKNDFKTGNFSVTVNKLYKESDATNLKMDVVYNGDKVGFVFPDKAGVKMPDGNEYATVKSSGLFAKSSALLLTKGKGDSFTLNWNRMEDRAKNMDMQKAEMFVKWNDTFAEVTPEHLKPQTLQMVLNEAASK